MNYSDYEKSNKIINYIFTDSINSLCKESQLFGLLYNNTSDFDKEKWHFYKEAGIHKDRYNIKDHIFLVYDNIYIKKEKSFLKKSFENAPSPNKEEMSIINSYEEIEYERTELFDIIHSILIDIESYLLKELLKRGDKNNIQFSNLSELLAFLHKIKGAQYCLRGNSKFSHKVIVLYNCKFMEQCRNNGINISDYFHGIDMLYIGDLDRNIIINQEHIKCYFECWLHKDYHDGYNERSSPFIDIEVSGKLFIVERRDSKHVYCF